MRSPLRWRKVFWLLVLLAIPAFTNCDCGENPVGSLSELEAIPKNMNFDALQGQKQTKKVIIQAKVGSVNITSIKLTKGEKYFSIDKDSMPALPKILEAGDQFTLSVTYTAPSGEAAGGTIQIESDASTPTDGILNIRLLATVNEKWLYFDPNPVAFNEVERGKSKTIEVVGENRGKATVKIEKVVWNDKSSKGFTFPDGLPKPRELKPGEQFKFKVKYEPTTAKIDQGKLEFTCAGGGCAQGDPDSSRHKNPYILHFSGALAAPNIDVQPLSIDFGFVEANTKATKNVKITNKGSAALTITKISMEEKSSGAFIVPRLVNVEIKAGESKELPVTFSPTTGDKHQGVIIIENNDPNKPKVLVRLFGQVSAPNIEVQPLVLDFGKAPVPKTMAITVANSGDRPLIVDSLAIMVGSAPEFKVDTSAIKFPWTLSPNKFQSIPVTFSPAGQGDKVGKILIISNDPDERRIEVELKAVGSNVPNCDLVPSPTQLNFGLSVIGKTKIIPLKWINQGGQECLVSKIVVGTTKGGLPPLGYNGPDVYHLSAVPKSCSGKDGNYTCNPPLKVAPGNSISFNVGFLPLQERPSIPGFPPNYTGWFDVTVNAKPDVRRVPLDGLATKSCVEVVPDNIDFGLVTVNCSSKNEKVVVYNTCQQSITVNKIGFSAAGANGFRIVRAQKTPFNIPTGQSAEIEVAYRATAPARKQNTVLQIEHTLKQQSPLSVPMIAEGTTTAEQTDTFKQLQSPKADILFVIDNSCSMGNDQNNLANNFGSFIKWAQTLKVDFQIGVVTTDIGGSPGSSGTPGQLVGPPSQKFITSNTPNLQAEFNQRVRVGTNGSAQEAGLEGAKLALSHPLATTGANKGFLRKDASLSIIAVSDEPDQSPQPAQFYINFFKNIKGYKNPDLFRFNVVIGIDEKTLKPQCGATGGQQNTGARSSGRYLAVAQASRGVIASICSTNWSQTLSRIGSVTFGLKSQFFLSRPADAKTITVRVDGKLVAKGATTWDFSTQDNSVTFKTAPKAGSIITVTYKAICF